MNEPHALVDIGVNLAHRSFQSDLKDVIARAFGAGVRTMIITGTSVTGSREAQQVAAQYPGQLYATAGVHPHDSRHCAENTIAELRQLASLPEVVAIGECGLDFNRDYSPRPEQERWFAAQVDLAEELHLPLFLHERDAHQRFREILTTHRRTVPAVLHCFTGNSEELRTCLDLGLYIGITGWICDERRGTHLRELIREVPAERLMLETDAPFLLPRSMKQKPKDGRNEPSFLPHVLETVAACLGKTPAEVAEQTTRNASEFFRLSLGSCPRRSFRD
jgi:TatD DNase family protein